MAKTKGKMKHTVKPKPTQYVPPDPTGGDPGLQRARAVLLDNEPERRPLHRVPLRPESPEAEVERYPERLRRHEEKAAKLAESKTPEAIAHRQTCTDVKNCQHAAHVIPRRPLKSMTKDDRRHLGSCPHEEETCDHFSHTLPPEPLDWSTVFCCAGQHYRRDDPRALSECPNVPAKLRARRKREQFAFNEGAKGFYGMSMWVNGQKVV